MKWISILIVVLSPLLAKAEALPTEGLCFGSEFPFEVVGDEPFNELYFRVAKETGIGNLGANHALCHWEASWSTLAYFQELNLMLIDQVEALTSELEECLAPPPPPIEPVEPVCDSTRDYKDGSGGALWKPVSESTGHPVALMPNRYCETKVSAWFDGRKLETARLRTCSANGNRAHHDFSKRCGDYPSNIIIQYKFSNGETDCRTVRDACKRYD